MPTEYTIYPSIGIARVGNSPDEFYIAPVTANALPNLPEGGVLNEPSQFRDKEGRLRRQAAEFTIYRSVDGGPQEEVTLKTAGVKNIRWTVHLANKKASWYEFQTKQGEDGYAPNHPLRNADKISRAAREALIIAPGPRSISGVNQSGVHFSRDTIPNGYPGSFPPADLKPYSIDTLGELRTNWRGGLIVLGGLGCSGSDVDPPKITQYANNDGWWDDTSDGTVSATIELDGEEEEIIASGAWVLVGPPSYAPQIGNIVTLYDTIFDAAVRKQGYRPDIFEDEIWKSGKDGYKPYFDTDIKPIFERADHYPWVAAIPPKPHTFDYDKMGDPNPHLNGLRHYYLDFIRAPGQENILINPNSGATMMPYLAGDDCLGAGQPGTVTAATSKYLRLTDTQYFMLTQWANGWFNTGAAPPDQPGDALTRGVLENCVGGAFSPGIEMTWISRNPDIYAKPFRIKQRHNLPKPLSLGYDPERGMEPGDVTRYMACPWQADFNECSSQPIEGRILWWWPAQRPEFVYEQGKDNTSGSLGAQVSWIGTEYNQNAPDYIAFPDDLMMVENWDKLGFVYNVGSDEEPHFVEVERKYRRTPGSQGDTGPDQESDGASSDASDAGVEHSGRR